jgi:hypothetical protein
LNVEGRVVTMKWETFKSMDVPSDMQPSKCSVPKVTWRVLLF